MTVIHLDTLYDDSGCCYERLGLEGVGVKSFNPKIILGKKLREKEKPDV